MVAGDRRRPAASSTANSVMGSPPNRTADRVTALPRRTTAGGRRAGDHAYVGDHALPLRLGYAQARKLVSHAPNDRPTRERSHGGASALGILRVRRSASPDAGARTT